MTTRNIVADDDGRTELVARFQKRFGLALRTVRIDGKADGNLADYIAYGQNSDIPLFHVWMRRDRGRWQWIGRIEHLLGPQQIASVNPYRHGQS